MELNKDNPKKKFIKISFKAGIIIACAIIFLIIIVALIIFQINDNETIENNVNNELTSEQSNESEISKIDNTNGLILDNVESIEKDDKGNITYYKRSNSDNKEHRFKYEYDNNGRITNVNYNVTDNQGNQAEYNYTIMYLDESERISKIVGDCNMEKLTADQLPTNARKEVTYTYDSAKRVTNIDKKYYDYNKDELVEEYMYSFKYGDDVEIIQTKKTVNYKLEGDYSLTNQGYSQEQESCMYGDIENIIVGKNAYAEILQTILEDFYYTYRSEAQLINSQTDNILMYPDRIETYQDNKLNYQYTYLYNDKNYLTTFITERNDNITNQNYVYKYHNNKMGKFSILGGELSILKEFTFENNKLISDENINFKDREAREKSYISESDIPISSEDYNLDTFDGTSYYMYVYLTDEKIAQGDFSNDLQLIGGTYNLGQEKGKWTLCVKTDLYDKVYNIIKSIDGVKDVEKTTKVFRQDDLNKIETSSDNKYLMQVWAKDSEFLNREFYTFCSNYGEVVDSYNSEDMYVNVILIDDSKYDDVYNELSKDNRIERIINDRQTLEEYQEVVNSGI